MTVSVAYPDKSFVESKKEYDFKKMREALRDFEKQSRFGAKKEDFKQCAGAVDKDTSAQCCMCGKIHLVKDMIEVGDGQ